MYKILELFAGSGILSRTFEENNNFNAYRVDIINNKFINLCADINDLSKNYFKKHSFDVVWVGLPCTYFSRYSYIRGHWKNGIMSKDVVKANLLNQHTIDIVEYISPKFYFYENPCGKLIDMEYMKRIPYVYELSQCLYGLEHQKNTYIWSNIPDLKFKKCMGKGYMNHNKLCKCNTISYDNSCKLNRGIYPKNLCIEFLKIVMDRI